MYHTTRNDCPQKKKKKKYKSKYEKGDIQREN